MIALHLDSGDIAELVDSLHDAADACAPHAPTLARKRRALANSIGDALDSLPKPTIREDHDTP